jgi:hypothetical protein
VRAVGHLAPPHHDGRTRVPCRHGGQRPTLCRRGGPTPVPCRDDGRRPIPCCRRHGGRRLIPCYDDEREPISCCRHGGRMPVPHRHGGRRPAIYVFPWFQTAATADQIVIEIPPFGVGAIDQPRLPGARPALHILFALDCRRNLLVPFDIYQPAQSIAAGELAADARPMLVCASSDFVGDTDVQRAIRPVGHDVNPATLHGVDRGTGNLRRHGWRAFAHHDVGELAGSARCDAGGWWAFAHHEVGELARSARHDAGELAGSVHSDAGD